MSKVSIYRFRHASEIYSDMKGNFFRMDNDKPLKVCYHSRRIAIRDGVKIYGVKRLRKNAYKSEKEISDCPF
jgi:hypothetical protein